MDLALLVYSISLIGKLNGILAGVTIVALIGAIVSSLFYLNYIEPDSYDRNHDGTPKTGWLKEQLLVKRLNKVFLIVLPIAIVLNIAVPSEKTAYLMVGAYAAQKVSENGKVNEMTEKVMKIIDGKLNSYVEEMTEKVGGKK